MITFAVFSPGRAHAEADVVINVDETITVADGVGVVPPAVVDVNETITVSDLVVPDILPAPPIGTLEQQAKARAGDGAEGDELGRTVAISGRTAVLGAPFSDGNATTGSGAVYVFVRSGDTWSQQARLEASDAADDDNFGISVAIYGDTIVVGAEYDDSAETHRGSAYVFTRSGTTWTEQAKLDSLVKTRFEEVPAI